MTDPQTVAGIARPTLLVLWARARDEKVCSGVTFGPEH
jgi:hypothetical protein